MTPVSPQGLHRLPDAPSCPHPPLVTGDPSSWDASRAFRQLREQAPVQQVVLPGGLVAWLITGAAQARQALADARLAHDMRRLPDPRQGFGGRRYPDDLFSAEGRHLLNSDGADHRRLRNVLAPLLSRTAAQRWEPFIARACAEFLDDMAAAARPDLVADYARPLAVRITATILGVPAGAQQQLSRLTLEMIRAVDPEDPAVRRQRTELFGVWTRIVGHKRRKPGDDLLTHLTLAHGQGRLSSEELLSVAWGLFSGGISPTTTLIACGAIEIMRSPELRQALSDEAAMGRITEELLRITSPFPVSVWRFALDDITFDDTVIAQGSVVLVALAAANRDPAAFPEPDTARLDRHGGHLSFGLGPHYCPGAPLARLQATVALTALFRRFPDLRPAVAETDLRRQGVLIERGYEHVPVCTNSIAPQAVT
ncbi:cytochrome P450 [Streptomyces cavernicola]|uniref:Cytochrome P450 n=1 Tax=Streptomyces cavernicola TaxID=3043613 RepID=A0ABT6SL32_9ACTN|nr:cytochrome P450 [Streptomyces sp. B-S-A6]MDI3408902.1 cytochrome P450 [Streptomyces sp. B-S-A6]